MTWLWTSKIRASTSLEASLFIVPLLLLLVSFLFILYSQLLALNLGLAMENMAEELALVFTIADELSEKLPDEVSSAFDKIIGRSERSILESLAGDYTSSVFLAPFIEKRLDYWLDFIRHEGGYSLPKHRRQIALEWDEQAKTLFLTLYLEVDTVFGPFEQEIYAISPLWSDHINNKENDREEEEGEERSDIWSESNFTRGKFFRDKAGSNLPFNFPVIAYYEQGRAKSVRSLDPNAPSYKNPDMALESICKDLNSLYDFESYQGNHNQINILTGEIKEKTYILFLPKNLPENYGPDFVSNLYQESAKRGIKLDLRRYGQSKRYSDNDGND